MPQPYEILSHNCQNCCYEKDKKQEVLVRKWKKREFSCIIGGYVCKLLKPLWKTVWRFLKKLKEELPYNLIISLLDIYPKKTKMII